MGSVPIFLVVDDLFVPLRADRARAIVEPLVEFWRPDSPAPLAITAAAFPAAKGNEIRVDAAGGGVVRGANRLEQAAQFRAIAEFRDLAQEARALQAVARRHSLDRGAMQRKLGRDSATTGAGNDDRLSHCDRYSGRRPS